MAFQRVYVEPCGKGFGYDLLIDNSVTSISVGQTYFISGTTGQPPKQQQIVGCFSVKNIKDVQSGPADSLTFSTPYLGCEECELANANFILLRTCFDSQYGQIIINIGDITPTPSIDDVFLMEVIILDDFGGSIRLTSCFSVSGFLSSNFDFNPTGVLSYSSRTDCQDCLNNSPIIHEVYDCIDSNEPYYIAFPSIGQVTDAVASSPTAPLSGVHSETKALKLYAGLSAPVVAPFGFTTIAVTVPTSDEPAALIVASTELAA